MSDFATALRRINPEVLIVGAGPVGLACASELSFQGVKALVVEQNARTGLQPRAKTTNVRTMSHLRRWGIAERVKTAAPLSKNHSFAIDFRTRMFGTPIVTLHDVLYMRPDIRDPRYPEPAQWIPQYKLESVLRAHVDESPHAHVCFNQRLEALRETPSGVSCRIADCTSGEIVEVEVPYVVGADGARSTTRDLLGFGMEGRHAYAQHIGLVIRAPALRAITASTPAIMYWLLNREAPAISSLMDDGDLWTYGFSAESGADFSERALKERIAMSYGRDIEPEIVAVDRWSAHSLLANKYSTARIFLIGDACHLHPPYGGYGMNLGVSDAVDIGWKIAAVRKGWGGDRLLATYELERRPAHVRIIEEAVANHSVLPADLVGDHLDDPSLKGQRARDEVGARISESKNREFRTLGVMLGLCYSNSTIVIPDGTDEPPLQYDDFAPVARPGCIAPHAWLRSGESLYDRFGAQFTLLVTRAGHGDDISKIQSAAKDIQMPLRVAEVVDEENLRHLYGADLILLRPDQHVAWRGDLLDHDAGSILKRARGATL